MRQLHNVSIKTPLSEVLVVCTDEKILGYCRSLESYIKEVCEPVLRADAYPGALFCCWRLRVRRHVAHSQGLVVVALVAACA